VRKILFLSQYFPPDITAAAFRISETATIINKDKDWKAEVLTAKPHRTISKNLQFKRFAYAVIRAPIRRLSRGGAINYLLHYISFMLSSIFWGIFKTKSNYDYIVTSSPPLFIGISGLVLSRFKKARFILDIRDIWPDSAVSTGKISKGGLLYKFGKKMEIFSYKKADLITCVSNPMKEYIEEHVKKNVIVLYNGFFTELSIKGKEKLKKNKIYTITYLGNIGHAQDISAVIKTAEKIRNKHVKFLFIGEGAKREGLEKEVLQKRLKNVEFKGPFSKEKSLEYMLSSSALLINLKDSKTFEKTIPSKVFDYMYANRPILFGIKGEGKKILSGVPGNIPFEPSNPESLKKAIDQLIKNYSFYKKNAKDNRKLLFEKYTRETMVDKLLEVISEL
jgi:glycosyltransferase involved in cell wall biosynthesis